MQHGRDLGRPPVTRQVLLHVGLPKSGTSYLHKLLSANRDRLRSAGVLFPGDDWSDQVVAVRDVRGRGLMWGIELADPVTGAWAGELAGRVQARALRGGLIVELGGRDDCVVRLLPPLNVTADPTSSHPVEFAW